jgi:hypothetical protein
MELPFIGSAYKGRSSSVDGQETINFYLEYLATVKFNMMSSTTIYSGQAESSKSTKVLYPTPGLTEFVTSSASGIVRQTYTTTTGRMFAVIGNQLSEFTTTGTEIYRGTLLTNQGFVSMADCGDGAGRGFGIVIVDGQFGYNFNLTNNSFEQIIDPTFVQASKVIFMNGYFIINELTSSRFRYSQLYDGLDWGDLNETWSISSPIAMQTGLITVVLLDSQGKPAVNLTNIANGTYLTITSSNGYLQGISQNYDTATATLIINITSFSGTTTNNWSVNIFTGSTRFYTKESTGDYLKTIATIHGELWLIGEQSIEVWYQPSGATDDNPFMRIHGAVMNNGTVAPNSVATNGANLFFLGSSAAGHGQVWMTTSYQPNVISTNSIDHMIESLPNIQDAIAFTYTQEGHEFYVLSFVQGNKTFVYDTSTGEWHERAYWNKFTGQFERYLPNTHCLFNQVNYVGDYRNGKIYSLDLDQYTDNGETVRRVRTGPHIHNDRRRIFFKEFEVDIERGVGLDGNGQGSDPVAFLQWSDDGGFTWSNEYWGRFGGKGQYKTRLHWHRLGYSRDRVFKLTVTDPVKCVLISARGDLSIENANAVQGR